MLKKALDLMTHNMEVDFLCDTFFNFFHHNFVKKLLDRKTHSFISNTLKKVWVSMTLYFSIALQKHQDNYFYFCERKCYSDLQLLRGFQNFQEIVLYSNTFFYIKCATFLWSITLIKKLLAIVTLPLKISQTQFHKENC